MSITCLPAQEVMERMMSKDDTDGKSKGYHRYTGASVPSSSSPSRTIQTQTSLTDVLSSLPSPPDRVPDKNRAKEQEAMEMPQLATAPPPYGLVTTEPRGAGGLVHPAPLPNPALAFTDQLRPNTFPAPLRQPSYLDATRSPADVQSAASASLLGNSSASLLGPSRDVTGRTLLGTESPVVRSSYKQANHHIM